MTTESPMLESLVNRYIYYPEPDWILTPDQLGEVSHSFPEVVSLAVK